MPIRPVSAHFHRTLLTASLLTLFFPHSSHPALPTCLPLPLRSVQERQYPLLHNVARIARTSPLLVPRSASHLTIHHHIRAVSTLGTQLQQSVVDGNLWAVSIIIILSPAVVDLPVQFGYDFAATIHHTTALVSKAAIPP